MDTENSEPVEKSKTLEKYSSYGEYSIIDKLQLTLPKTEIEIERKSENQFSYYRKNSENQIAKKLIPRRGKDLKIELVPMLPLNLPAKKTNDLMFLRLAKSVFIEKKSKIDILLQFPIEIGVFIIDQNDGSKDFFDCFTCEPMHSRFALYGNPEVGKLCMYSKVAVLEKHDYEPYIFALMKATITNELNNGVSIGKLVFRVTDHDIYYKDYSSEAHIDDIEAIIKKETSRQIIKIRHIEYSKLVEKWKLAPRTKIKDEKIQFIMDEGFD